ncbi:MAG: 2-C-methyl-D-erythritol 4-phosphate cytidylyltransferase [Bacteroidetes bacterium]|nr:2-C-methyl-D-erythritol 4-phosphate cytidylyltransferase [Bacteroidota bacterium]
MPFHLVVPAAGSGSRLGGEPKQFRLLGGVPVLIRTIEAFLSVRGFEGVVIAAHAGQVGRTAEMLRSFFGDGSFEIVAGGDTRQESVRRALDAVPDASELVLIHDAVRPFVTNDLVESIVDLAKRRGAACPAVPVADTLRRVLDNEFGETIDRRNLWQVQTPQAFRLEAIRASHEWAARTGLIVTDDVELYQRHVGPVVCVEGDRRNFKITDAGDWELAEILVSGGKTT